MLYKQKIQRKTTINKNNSTEGIRIEELIYQVEKNGEPIKDVVPMVYTERKNGVEAQYNVRTDRFDIALEAMDTVQKSKMAKRDDFYKGKEDNILQQTKQEVTE